MTISKLLLAASVTGLSLVSCKQTASAPPADNQAAVVKHTINPEKVQTASFTITGMTCAIGCAKTIEEKLTDTDGVQKATVDFDKKLATVAYDSSLQSPESLTKIVESAADGKTYKVSDMIASK